eukprot:gene9110-biopygen10175
MSWPGFHLDGVVIILLTTYSDGRRRAVAVLRLPAAAVGAPAPAGRDGAARDHRPGPPPLRRGERGGRGGGRRRRRAVHGAEAGRVQLRLREARVGQHPGRRPPPLRPAARRDLRVVQGGDNSMGSWTIQGSHHWVALATGTAQEFICWRLPQALDPIELGAGHRRCKNAVWECGAGNRRCEEIRALALATGAGGPARWRWHLALRLAPALGAGLAPSLLALGWRWREALALVWRWPIRR